MKKDYKKYIYKVAIVILVIFFVGGVGMGAADILGIEGTKELYVPADSLSAFPQTDEDRVNYINACLTIANDKAPKISKYETLDVEDFDDENGDGHDCIVTPENPAVNAIFAKVRDADEYGIEARAENAYEGITRDFYEGFSDVLSPLDIDLKDVTSTELKYEYYSCTMCGASINPGDYGEECPECGNINTLNLRYSDVYEITIHIDPTSKTFDNCGFPQSAAIADIVINESNGFYDAKTITQTQIDSYIYAKINRLTDRIEYLELRSEAENLVNLAAAENASGEAYNILFHTVDKYRFDFTWPGISFNNHKMTIDKKTTDVIKATLICDDPLNYTVKWSSSDENLVSVDEEGYIKSGKEYGTCTITGEYEFGGITYKDTCEVIVGVAMEGLDLSKGKLKLKVGETFDIEPKFDPKDSTDTLVNWYSEDESIATIDENGVVTAVSAGNVVVYAISHDGNFYSSCDVEVTG